MGGLGNWMFQIAYLEYLALNSGQRVTIEVEVKPSSHSNENYIDTVFEAWKNLHIGTGKHYLYEKDADKMSAVGILNKYPNACLIGNFQKHKYISQSFLDKLRLPTESLNRHPQISNTVFLHIRGGDYLLPQNSLHNVNLDSYYEKAIALFSVGTHFSIFTNDVEYAKTKPFLNSISHTFIDEAETDSMYLMSQCKGGICGNSTFSWWGARLNPNRTLAIPSKWTNEPNQFIDLEFKGSTIVEI